LSKTMDELAKAAANEVDQDLLGGLIRNFESAGQLPPAVDRPLIGRAGRTFGRLDQKQMRELRLLYVAAMKRRLAGKPDPGIAQS